MWIGKSELVKLLIGTIIFLEALTIDVSLESVGVFLKIFCAKILKLESKRVRKSKIRTLGVYKMQALQVNNNLRTLFLLPLRSSLMLPASRDFPCVGCCKDFLVKRDLVRE